MKKFIIAALAASVLATPVLADPGNGRPDNNRYEQRHDDRRDERRDIRQEVRHDVRQDYRAQQYRNWQRGQRFDARYARNYQVIGSPYAYHLRPAPRGYRWVRSGNDAVMVGIATGLIAAVMAGAIH